MRVGKSAFLLVRTDEVLSCLPIISTPVNAVNIFVKGVLATLAVFNRGVISKNYYFSYLHNKSLSDCVFLLIPFVGNFVVAKKTVCKEAPTTACRRSQLLRDVRTDANAINGASPALKNDREFMLEAMRQNSRVIVAASPELRNNPAFMLEALRISFEASNYIGDDLKDNAEFMLEASGIHMPVIAHTGSVLRTNSQYMLEIIRQHGSSASQLLDNNILADDELFMTNAITIVPPLYHRASQRLRQKHAFTRYALRLLEVRSTTRPR